MDSQIEHMQTADMQENAHHPVLISFKLLHLIDIERVSRVLYTSLRWSNSGLIWMLKDLSLSSSPLLSKEKSNE